MSKPEKVLFTRRINKKLIEKLKRVKKKTGKSHTQFIEEAIDEKLLREKFASKSVIYGHEVDN